MAQTHGGGRGGGRCLLREEGPLQSLLPHQPQTKAVQDLERAGLQWAPVCGEEGCQSWQAEGTTRKTNRHTGTRWLKHLSSSLM